MNTLTERLAALGHVLPSPKAPAANYVSHSLQGRLLTIAGQIGRPGLAKAAGPVGGGLDVEAARLEAQRAALGLLAVLDSVIAQDLGRVVQVLRVGVFIATTADFDGHSAVANGASDLIVAALGEPGRHARTAVGVASLPTGAAVEVEATVWLKDEA